MNKISNVWLGTHIFQLLAGNLLRKIYSFESLKSEKYILKYKYHTMNTCIIENLKENSH